MSKTDKSLRRLMVIAAVIMFIISWFAFSDVYAAEVQFQWGGSTGTVNGYRIYWGDTADGPYDTMLGEVNGTTLNYTATLDEAQEYYLICRAFNSYGESVDSNVVHWLYELPGEPTNFSWPEIVAMILDKVGSENIRVALTFGP